MYFFEFLSRAIKSKNIKAIIGLILAMLVPTAILGTVCFLISGSLTSYLIVAILELFLTIVCSSRPFEISYIREYLNCGKQVQIPEINDKFHQIAANFEEITGDRFSNIRFTIDENESSFYGVLIGKKTVMFEAGIANLSDEMIDGAIASALEGTYSGQGLHHVIAYATSVLPLLLWKIVKLIRIMCTLASSVLLSLLTDSNSLSELCAESLKKENQFFDFLFGKLNSKFREMMFINFVELKDQEKYNKIEEIYGKKANEYCASALQFMENNS